jgi:hypothetical protein
LDNNKKRAGLKKPGLIVKVKNLQRGTAAAEKWEEDRIGWR